MSDLQQIPPLRAGVSLMDIDGLEDGREAPRKFEEKQEPEQT